MMILLPGTPLTRTRIAARSLCATVLAVPVLLAGTLAWAHSPHAAQTASASQVSPDSTRADATKADPARTESLPVVTRSASPSASTPTLVQQIAALPRIDNAGIDGDARGKQVLAHLNAVLRFYRGELSQVQKVGEPSDVLYSQQAVSQATQMAQYAFQSARNVAALLNRLSANSPATPVEKAAPVTGTPPAPGAQPAGQQAAPASTDADGNDPPAEMTEAQRMSRVRLTVQARVADLTAQDGALDKQILTAKAADLPALRLQDEQLEGQLELQKAMLEGLSKIASLGDATATTGLAGEIERLLRTAPELSATNVKVVPPPVLDSLSAALDSGVSTQAIVLFQLLSARHDIDNRIEALDALRQQANDMRTPLVRLLRSTIQQGDAAIQGAGSSGTSDAPTVAATRKRYDTLTATFRVLAATTLPLSQEIVQLEQSRANFVSWRAAVDAEYNTVLRHLLLRVLSIALALGALLIVSHVWQRLTVKYVHDLRRRRQLMMVRRIVLGFFSGIVIIFGFVTQFSSLATFAGFITAGIAVGLQTILLSVAAYFFIVGRYGVRVGDRITVAGVTGDVVDVGLVRFYMMELTGTGTELHPTGRVAVFANSVLFQAGTPLYKQMPGTEYAWHEVTVKLKPDTDYRAATQAILRTVQDVYEGYRARIELQHRQVEDWMDTVVEVPHIEPRLQLAETGLQYAVLFPVEIRDAATTDEKIVHLLLDDMAKDDAMKNSVAAPPTVKAVIKG